MLNLHELAKRGNLTNLIQRLTTKDIVYQINATDEDGNSLLYLAAYYGHASLIAPLLKAGANPHQSGGISEKTPLFAAIQEGHWQVVNELIINKVDCLVPPKQGTYKNWYPIHAAAYIVDLQYLPDNEKSRQKLVNYLKVIDLLLEQGASINIPILFRSSWLDETLHTPLTVAIRVGAMSIIKHLIKRGANVNQILKTSAPQESITPLYVAVESPEVHNKNLPIVNYLIEKGANVNAICGTPQYAKTVLSIACNDGHDQIIQSLLAAKAQPNVIYATPDYKQMTPLLTICLNHYKYQKASHNVMDLLIKASADFYTPLELNDVYGKATPLVVAIAEEAWEVVITLLDHGAGIGVDLDQIPSRTNIEKQHPYFEDGELTWDDQLEKFLENINTSGIVIGLKVRGNYVTRQTQGFSQAITHLDELKAAILSENKTLDYATLLKVTRVQLASQPDSRELQQLQRTLLLHAPAGLKQTCLEFFNSKREYRRQAHQANLPQELRGEIDPVDGFGVKI